MYTSCIDDDSIILAPMDVTPDGMVIEERELQYVKALAPIAVTVSGMVTEDKEVHLKNGSSPIVVTPLSMTNEPMLEQSPSILLGTAETLPGMVNVPVRPEQSLKALFPMVVTLLGIVIPVRP